MYSLTEIQLMEVVTAYNNILAILQRYIIRKVEPFFMFDESKSYIYQSEKLKISRDYEYRILSVKSSAHKYIIKE